MESGVYYVEMAENQDTGAVVPVAAIIVNAERNSVVFSRMMFPVPMVLDLLAEGVETKHVMFDLSLN